MRTGGLSTPRVTEISSVFSRPLCRIKYKPYDIGGWYEDKWLLESVSRFRNRSGANSGLAILTQFGSVSWSAKGANGAKGGCRGDCVIAD